MLITLLLIFALLALAGFMLVNAWSALGKAASGDRLQRIEASAIYRDGKFRNRLPLKNFLWRTIRDGYRGGEHMEPGDDLLTIHNDGSIYLTKPTSGLRVTWLGHSTLLLELDDARLLIDPVWGTRASPFSWLGPRRWYDPPLALADLPSIDAVLISHDHYDHLDEPTILQLADIAPRFIVPLGVGAHLEYWGIKAEKITELEWWQQHTIGSIEITATPARHASGRHAFDLDKTLWAGFAMRGSQSVYYSGDTGLFPGFKEIGERLGPFDLTMIETGAYNRNWPDWHLGPEQAVVAHQWVRGRRLLPLHWGLFNLARHNWTEPMERVLTASERLNLPVLTPRPGQPFEPGISELGKWWPDLPWEGADSHAILSTQLQDLEEHETKLINGQPH
jgi:L-ascorbate metabolism protein UlaG (beta-lactamase superfamily)